MATKAKDFREKGPADLELELEKLAQEVYNLRSQTMDGKSVKTHLIRQKRKEIARIKTVQNERSRG